MNINYQPFGSATHLTKRQEMKSELERLVPKPGVEFEALAGNIALDARCAPPTSVSDIMDLYRKQVLDDDMNTKKGHFMKQSAWYDIILCISKHDTSWHSRRLQVEQVAALLRGKGAEGKKQIAQVAQQVLRKNAQAESTKEEYRQNMKHLRKSAGNCLLLAPRLANNSNLVNSRIMLLVSRLMWTEQTFWGASKATPQQDFHVSVRLAEGLGDDMAKRMWKDSVADARELHRLGIPVVQGAAFIDVSLPTGRGGKDLEPGVPLQEAITRLMSFLLHFMEARLWSYAWCQFAYPEAFAALFSPSHANKAWQNMQELWLASTDAEANAHLCPPAWGLRQSIYWLDLPIVQFLFRWLIQASHTLCPEPLRFLRMLLTRIGDTKCVEESHRIGRGLEKSQNRNVLEPEVLFARLQREDTPLQQRCLPHVQAAKDSAYQPMKHSKLPKSGLTSWAAIHAKRSLMRMPRCIAGKKDCVLGGKYVKKRPLPLGDHP